MLVVAHWVVGARVIVVLVCFVVFCGSETMPDVNKL